MSTPTHQAVNGEIKDLQIYSCCYNPLRRKDTMNLVNIYIMYIFKTKLKVNLILNRYYVQLLLMLLVQLLMILAFMLK